MRAVEYFIDGVNLEKVYELQFGHGMRAVEYLDPMQYTWCKKELQFGHGMRAVEYNNCTGQRTETMLASIRPRHESRGILQVPGRRGGTVRGFNSATA